jgi:integrase
MGKRGNGEVSIYQRASDGKWCSAITVGYESGKPKRKMLYGKTRKEVADKLAAALRDQQQGLPVTTERQTVAQFLMRWLADTIAPNRRAKTYRSYEQIVRCHLVPDLGRLSLAKLTPQQVQALLKRKQAAGLSPRTVAYIRAVLRQALNQALRWGLVARNVASLVEPPKVERYQITPLTPQQASRLLDAAQGNRLEALYRVALSLGLRQGEALGLRWEDIDFEVRTLHVAVALQAVGGNLALVAPKTENARRTLSLPVALASALKTHRARQAEQRLKAGTAWQDNGLVFCTRVGTPIHPRNLVRSFQALRERAGLPSMRFHDLRHFCLSLLAAQGVPARVTMEIAGHSDIRLTLSVYTHVYDEAKQQAAEVMDKLFPPVIKSVGD